MTNLQVPTILEADDINHLANTFAQAFTHSHQEGEHMDRPHRAVLRAYIERTPSHARPAFVAFLSLHLGPADQLRLAHLLLDWAKEDDAKA